MGRRVVGSIVAGGAAGLAFIGCVSDSPVVGGPRFDDAGNGGEGGLVGIDAMPIDAKDVASEASLTGCEAYALLKVGAASFCDDFDGPAALWFKRGDTGLSIGSPGRSAPNGLAATATGVVPAGPYYWARVEGATRATARVELDLRFDAIGSASQPRVGLVGYAPNGGAMGLDGARHLRLEVQDGGKLVVVAVDEAAISANLIEGPEVVTDRWIHLSMSVLHSTAQVTLDIDGTPISTVALPDGFPAPGGAVLAAGVLYTHNVGDETWTARYDNVGIFLK